MKNREPLGNFVSRKRRMLGLTQRDMALALGYTFQAISKFESEGGALPISVLPSLANILETDFQSIYDRNAEAPKLQIKYDPVDVDIFVDNIVFLRGLLGYSQAQEADFLGVSKRSIINYEQGASIPNTRVLERLVDLYGVSMEDFLYKNLMKEAQREEILARKKKLMPAWLKNTYMGAFIALLIGGGMALVTPNIIGKAKDNSDSIYVSTASQLQTALTADSNASVVLLNDIDCEGVSWAPIGNVLSSFSGTLDGNGHAIHNLSIINPDPSDNSNDIESFGFFSVLSGTVKDVCFDNISMDLKDATGYLAGTVAGTLIDGAKIENVKITNSSLSVAMPENDENSFAVVGGLAGGNAGRTEISKCILFDSEFKNERGYTGGLIGESLTSIEVSNTAVAGIKVYAAEERGSVFCQGIGIFNYTEPPSNDYKPGIYCGPDIEFYVGEEKKEATGDYEGISRNIEDFSDPSFFKDTLELSEQIWKLDNLSYEDELYPTLIDQK